MSAIRAQRSLRAESLGQRHGEWYALDQRQFAAFDAQLGNANGYGLKSHAFVPISRGSDEKVASNRDP